MARYIDADALIRSISESILKAIEWGKTASCDEIKIRAEQAIATFCEVSLMVKEQPTADVVERKRGEWIEDGYQDYPCVCSVCGTPQDIKAKFLFSYCPNCDADMRKEVKSC